jgi:DNA-binding response OmpR family regulator
MCRRILVAVQCHSLADRIALGLESSGHKVRIACDGQAALVVARNFDPEVVLLDATMERYRIELAMSSSPSAQYTSIDA